MSSAVIYPKYRADLVACAAITRAMYEGNVESVHYPRNPLDVLAQQIVAMVAVEAWDVADLFRVVQSAAPYAGLTLGAFESVLDMLSGRYPSDEFAELRPRITWDRVAGKLTTRQGARNVAIINGGTIPDRGLYGVFLAGATKGARVGELDEEMVFESRTGDTIILGASTWRIEEYFARSRDRFTCSRRARQNAFLARRHRRPSRGVRRKDWRDDARTVAASALRRVCTNWWKNTAWTPTPRKICCAIWKNKALQRSGVPSDEDILIEICRDELGDRRVCVLTPFGSRVHAPWCMAVTARLRAERGIEVGIDVVRRRLRAALAG